MLVMLATQVARRAAVLDQMLALLVIQDLLSMQTGLVEYARQVLEESTRTSRVLY
jgi:hypothetical protein